MTSQPNSTTGNNERQNGQTGIMALALAIALLSGSALAAAQVRSLYASPQPDDPLANPRVNDPLHGNDSHSGMTSLGKSQPPLPSGKRPVAGQPGKNAAWFPTPAEAIAPMLAAAGLHRGDLLIDLGSGDGRIVIAAARDFGAAALGVEYNPELVALSRQNAIDAHVSGRASFRHGDIFATDFSHATVLTLYLSAEANLLLRERLLHLRPGTRILSYAFGMGDWSPDRTISIGRGRGYLWIVPAKLSGRWAFEVGPKRFVVEIGQHFQKLTLAPGTPLQGAVLQGNNVRFLGAGGHALTGRVENGRIEGQGWTAYRIRPTRK